MQLLSDTECTRPLGISVFEKLIAELLHRYIFFQLLSRASAVVADKTSYVQLKYYFAKFIYQFKATNPSQSL
jgi:hypothetical protein